MELITLAEYKVFAGLSSPNQDAQLTQLIEFVNQFVSDYLGFLASYVEYADAQDTFLLPSTQTVSSISGDIYVDDVLVPNTTITTFMQIGYKIKLSSSVTGKLVFTMAAPTTNPAIKEACFLLIKHYTKEEYKPSMQVGQEQVNTSEPKSLPIHIKNILDLYRGS